MGETTTLIITQESKRGAESACLGDHGEDLIGGDLPAGWETREASDGQRFYIDHTTRITSWLRPLADVHETTRPLPLGFERRRTRDGRLYFGDHNIR